MAKGTPFTGLDIRIPEREIIALNRALEQLPFAMQRRVIFRGLQAAGGVFRDAAKPLAPKRTGTLRTKLRVKRFGRLGVGVGPLRQDFMFNRAKLKSGKTKLRKAKKGEGGTVTVRPSRYAHLVDRGTKRMRARPFISKASRTARNRAQAKAHAKISEAMKREGRKIRQKTKV